MRHLISLTLVVALAVLLTLLAKFNPGKVAIFVSNYRIDFSLNFAIVLFLVMFVGSWMLVGAFKASGKMPGRVRGFFTGRKQKNLMKANTDAVIALITGDDQLADRALRVAQKTGIEGDLSYLIRALSAMQANRMDIADTMLAADKATGGDHAHAIELLKAQVALSKRNFEAALTHCQALPAHYAKFPQVRRVKTLALAGAGQWQEALSTHRQGAGSAADAELGAALAKVYSGLCTAAGTDANQLKSIAQDAKPDELQHLEVLEAMVEHLMRANLVTLARKTLEQALSKQLRLEVLPLYQQVAGVESREALPFVEKLLADHPDDTRLLELAADVCEKEQLWGKAISRFERVYQQQPAAHVAGRLERLYELANQPEKAKQWHEKLKIHLGLHSQVA